MKSGGRQSTNVVDRRITPYDVSMGMNSTADTQAAPKGNRPRYDKALNQIRSEAYAQKKKVIPHIEDMLRKGGL